MKSEREGEKEGRGSWRKRRIGAMPEFGVASLDVTLLSVSQTTYYMWIYSI